jgi:hypothetical protein
MDEDIEITGDVKLQLAKRHAEIVKMIEAFTTLAKTKEWEVLEELVFKKSLRVIENQLIQGTLTKEIDTNKLYRLQGEWSWANQYSNINKFMEVLKKQLEEINKKIK